MALGGDLILLRLVVMSSCSAACSARHLWSARSSTRTLRTAERLSRAPRFVVLHRVLDGFVLVSVNDALCSVTACVPCAMVALTFHANEPEVRGSQISSSMNAGRVSVHDFIDMVLCANLAVCWLCLCAEEDQQLPRWPFCSCLLPVRRCWLRCEDLQTLVQPRVIVLTSRSLYSFLASQLSSPS